MAVARQFEGNQQWANWPSLMRDIRDGRCTPVLGAGASCPLMPLGGELSRMLVQDELAPYPYDDVDNLPRVAEYLAVAVDDPYPRHRVRDILGGREEAKYATPPMIYEVLARMSFKIFVTTNYDSLMMRALSAATLGKKPSRRFCAWRDWLRDESGAGPFETPSQDTPLVFHLHGVLENQDSMVLTASDYLDFITAIGTSQEIIPAKVQSVFGLNRILFLGYSLEDSNFQILLRAMKFNRFGSNKGHLAVLAPPDFSDPRRMQKMAFTGRRLKNLGIEVYWRTCDEFATELAAVWENKQ